MSQAVSAAPISANTSRVRWISCLLIKVSDDIRTQKKYIEEAISISARHNGVVINIMVSLQLVAFGTHGGSRSDCERNRELASEELIHRLGEHVKMVTFQGSIEYGLVGKERADFTLFTPYFEEMVSELLHIKGGDIKDFTKAKEG